MIKKLEFKSKKRGETTVIYSRVPVDLVEKQRVLSQLLISVCVDAVNKQVVYKPKNKAMSPFVCSSPPWFNRQSTL